ARTAGYGTCGSRAARPDWSISQHLSEAEYRFHRQGVAMVDSDAHGDVAFGRVLCSALALFSLAAGAIHLSAASDHREHGDIFVFFVVVACLQLAWAGLV